MLMIVIMMFIMFLTLIFNDLNDLLSKLMFFIIQLKVFKSFIFLYIFIFISFHDSNQN